MRILNLSATLLGSTALLFQSGCCCCWGDGSWRMPTFTTDEAADGAALDPEAAKELEDARNYAGQALSKKGYGPVKTANLQKDGTNWYVSGTASGLDGGEVSYIVWFIVTTAQRNNQVVHTWAAKQVTIDGEVVFP